MVMKTDSRFEIIRAMESTCRGQKFICDLVQQILRTGSPSLPANDRLTPSERVILREIAMGKTTKEIAFEKNLSFHTVNSHRKNIFRKLEVNNVHEAIRYAMRAGIVDMNEYYI